MWHDSCLHFGVGLVSYATLNCSFFCLVTIVQLHWLVTSFLFYFLSNSSLIFTLFFFVTLLAGSLDIEGRTMMSVCSFHLYPNSACCPLNSVSIPYFVEWHQYGLTHICQILGAILVWPLSFFSLVDPSLNFYLHQFSFGISEKFCSLLLFLWFLPPLVSPSVLSTVICKRIISTLLFCLIVLSNFSSLIGYAVQAS